MIPRKNKLPPVANKLQGAAFAEKIISKYSSARSDIWSRLSLVFREDAALAPVENESARQFLMNIRFLFNQKEENLSLYKRIHLNQISRLINKYVGSVQQANSYPAGNGRRRWAAGGHPAAPPGRAWADRDPNRLPVHWERKAATDIRISRTAWQVNPLNPAPADFVNFLLYGLNASVPGPLGRLDKHKRPALTGKNTQTGKEYAAAGDFIINFSGLKSFKNFLSIRGPGSGGIDDFRRQAKALPGADPAPDPGPREYRHIAPGIGKYEYKDAKKQFLYLKDSYYFWYPSLLMRVLRQTAKTDRYLGESYLNAPAVRGDGPPAAYDYPGFAPGIGAVFAGRPRVSYGGGFNYRQIRPMPLVRNLFLSGSLGGTFATALERSVQVRWAAKTREGRESGLNAQHGWPALQPGAYTYPGLFPGTGSGYTGTTGARGPKTPGIIEGAFVRPVERIIQPGTVKAGGPGREKSLEALPGGPATYGQPGFAPGIGFVFAGRPRTGYGGGFGYQQIPAMPAARNFILPGSPGGTFATAVEKIIQVRRAAKTGAPDRETGLNALFGRPAGFPVAPAYPGPVSGTSLGYHGTTGEWSPNILGIIERAFAWPVERIIQPGAVKAGGPGREMALGSLFTWSAGGPAAYTYPGPVPGVGWGYDGTTGARSPSTPGIIERAFVRLVEKIIQPGAVKAGGPGREKALDSQPHWSAGGPAAYDHPGFTPEIGRVFAGRLRVSYGGEPKHQQVRAMPAVRNLILPGSLGRTLAAAVERIIQVRWAARTGALGRETGLNALFAWSAGGPAAHPHPGPASVTGWGYDGTIGARDIKILGIIERALGRPVEKIIRWKAVKAGGPDRERVLDAQPGWWAGGPAAYDHPMFAPGIGRMFGGRPRVSYGGGPKYRQIHSMPVVRNFMLSGSLGRTLAAAVERSIQARRAAKTGAPGRETGLDAPFGGLAGFPAAHTYPGPVAGMGLAYAGTTGGRVLKTPGTIARAFDRLVERSIQAQWAAKTGAPGREKALDALLRWSAGLWTANIHGKLVPGVSLDYDGANVKRDLKPFGIDKRALGKPGVKIIQLLGAAKAGGAGREIGLDALPGGPAAPIFSWPLSGKGPGLKGSPRGRSGHGPAFWQVLWPSAGRDIRISMELLFRSFDRPSQRMLKVLRGVAKTTPPGGKGNLSPRLERDGIWTLRYPAAIVHVPGSGQSGPGETPYDGSLAAAGRAAASFSVLFSRYLRAGAAVPKPLQPVIYYQAAGAWGPGVSRGNGRGLLPERAPRQGGPAGYHGKVREIRGQIPLPHSGRPGQVGNRAREGLAGTPPDRGISSSAGALTIFRQDRVFQPGGHTKAGQIKMTGQFEKVLVKIVDKVRHRALDRLAGVWPQGGINRWLTGPRAGKTNRATVAEGRQKPGSSARYGPMGEKTGLSWETHKQYFLPESNLLKAFPGLPAHGEMGRRDSAVMGRKYTGGYFLKVALRAGRDNRLTGYRAAGVSPPAEGHALDNKSPGLAYIYPGEAGAAAPEEFPAAAPGTADRRQSHRQTAARNTPAGPQRAPLENRELTGNYPFLKIRRNTNLIKIYDLEERYDMTAIFRKALRLNPETMAGAGQTQESWEARRSFNFLPSMEYRKQVLAEEDRTTGSRAPAPGASARRVVNHEDIVVPAGHTPKIDINRIADKVYREIEKRFKWERQRRGI